MEKYLAEWGSGDDEGDDEEGSKKGLPEKKKKKLLDSSTWKRDARLVETATDLRELIGGELYENHNQFREDVDVALKKLGRKLPAAELKLILKTVSWRVETAPPVVAKVHKPGKATPDPLWGLYEATINGKLCVVEYEPDTDLRDSEQVPLLEDGGVEAFKADYQFYNDDRAAGDKALDNDKFQITLGFIF